MTRFVNVLSPVVTGDVRFSTLVPNSLDGDVLSDVSEEAWRLSRSIRRCRDIINKFAGEEEFPFELGINIEDHNGLHQMGVRITDCTETLPEGRAMPFQPEDILISMNGSYLYDVYDVSALLYAHGTNMISGGIEEPISFVAIRGNQQVSGATTYWFNKSFFEKGYRKQTMPTKGGSAFWGAFDGGCGGFGEEVGAAGLVAVGTFLNALGWCIEMFDDDFIHNRVDVGSYSKLRWGATQKEAMRQQWYKEATMCGEVLSLFYSFPRKILQSIGSRSVKKFAGSIPGRAAFEAGEATAWSLADGSPLRNSTELSDELKRTIPIAAIGGVVQGVFKIMRK